MIEGRVAPARRVVVGRRLLAFPPPVAVAMPGEPHVVHVAEYAWFDDAVERSLVHRVVVSLVADFEDAAVLLGRGLHPLAAGDVPRHHLLAEDVLACVEAPARNLGVHPERRR